MAYKKPADFTPPEIKCQNDRTAVVHWLGQHYSLGPWNGKGTPPPAVMAKYLKVLSLWQQQLACHHAGVVEPENPEAPTLNEGIRAYLHFLRTTRAARAPKRGHAIGPAGGDPRRHSVALAVRDAGRGPRAAGFVLLRWAGPNANRRGPGRAVGLLAG